MADTDDDAAAADDDHDAADVWKSQAQTEVKRSQSNASLNTAIAISYTGGPGAGCLGVGGLAKKKGCDRNHGD